MTDPPTAGLIMVGDGLNTPSYTITLSKALLPFICNFYAPAPSKKENIPTLRPPDRMMLLLLLLIAAKLAPALDRFPMEPALLEVLRKETCFGGQEHPEPIPPCMIMSQAWPNLGFDISAGFCPSFKKSNTQIIYPPLERFVFLLVPSLSFLFLPALHPVTALSKAHGATGNEGLCGSPHTAEEPEQAPGSVKAKFCPQKVLLP